VQADTPIKKDAIKDLKPCRCKESKCLKLYCECLKFGMVCGVDCACIDCKNIEGHPERQQFLDQIKNRQEVRLKSGEATEGVGPGGIAKTS
jgi:hypothetical protein